MRRQSKTDSGFSKPIIIVAGLVVIAALIVTTLELTNTTHIFHKASATTQNFKRTPTTGGASVSNDKGEPTSSSTSTPSETSRSEPGDTKSTTDVTGQASLVAPTGNFVSDHHPNLSGSPAPNTVTSVCTTTPGATCYISFTKDGVTKKLNTETTDRGGSAYWNWKLQDIGLTAGSWKITATATLNGQTMSSSDALNLEVSQ